MRLPLSSCTVRPASSMRDATKLAVSLDVAGAPPGLAASGAMVVRLPSPSTSVPLCVARL